MADISKIERKGILYNIKDATARNLLQQKYTVPIGGIPKEDLSLEVQDLLQAAKTAIQNYTETDPTVPAWAKAVNKPTYTAEEVGALPNTTHIPVDPVNADWNASSGLALILNKPALFSGDYNDLINKPVIPSGYDDTALSGRITALENAGFITQESDPTVPSWAKASTKPSYTASEVGALPADTVIPVIPTNVSSFVNDAGYLTQHLDISGKANISDLATVAMSGSYNDLIDKPVISSSQRTLINIDDSDGLVFTDSNGDELTHAQVKALLDDEATDIIFYKDCYFYILQYIEDGDYLFQCFECDAFVVHVLEFYWADNAFSYSTADYDYSVDYSLNDSSSRPVQNRIITAALNGKQNTLTFDSLPTANSNNPVKSSGLYTLFNKVAFVDSYSDASEMEQVIDDGELKSGDLGFNRDDEHLYYVNTPNWEFVRILDKYDLDNLATVATSGSYNDLTDTPDVPIAISVNEQSFVMNQFHAFVIPDYYTKTQIDSAGYVTSSDVADAVADLVDSAPSTLDTLNELAAALGDDPNFATTIATALGNKVDKEVGKGLFSGSYNDLTNKPNIPSAYDDTALSNRVTTLENAGFLTSETDPNVPAWAKATTKPSYTASEVGALPDTTVIPTATSQLTNDSGFLTTHQDISGKQDALTAGDGIAIDSNDTIRTTGIPFGRCDSTSTATVFTATVPGIYKLEDGVCAMIENGVVTSASGFTLNVNGLGAKPCYTNLAAATRDTTLFNVAYTMLFVYDEERVSGGCWVCYRGYDANTNTIGYQVRSNSMSLPTSQKFYRYRLLFTSADGTHYVPANTSSSTNATSSRTVNQTPIDPFGHIVYYGTTAAVEANARPAASSLWVIYTLSLGYSFNRTGAALTLDDWAPVYLKCAPQADGSAIIDENTPYVQALPNTADGKIYIFLGVAYNATSIELLNNHHVYYHDGTGIRIWTGKTIPSKTSELTNDSNFVQSTSLATVATSGSYNDLSNKPTIPAAYDDTALAARVTALEGQVLTMTYNSSTTTLTIS